MQLIKNEWIKIWSQKNAWAMLIILIGILGLVAGLNKYFDPDQSTAEKRIAANEETMKFYDEMLAMGDLAVEDKAYYEEQKLIAQYRIDNDLKSEDATTFNSHMDMSTMTITMMIGIFTVVIAAGIVSSEFGTGTIKMLLTRPVARWKILLSKLISSILYGFTLLIGGLAFAALLGFVLFGSESSPLLTVVNGAVVEQEVASTFLESLLYSCASILMTIFFAFMIGSIFGSSTLAVGLSLFILLMGTTVTMFIAKYEFAKYIWFANDLSQYAPGSSPIIPDLTINFSLIVNVVYAIIFLGITFVYFMKRDITA
ncbi:MAG: ABC transporter permease [Solibacillus sp.]|uniref:ABC transporter permease n=1 Tax=Solibacillus sp. TaxID=1909654 RepID=UPI003315F3DC